LGVAYASTYSAALKQVLEETAPGLTIDVRDLGVSGYSSYQGLKLLEHYAEQYRPDAAVLYFGHNDAGYAVGYTDAEQPRREHGGLLAVRGVLWKARLYQLCCTLVGKCGRLLASEKAYRIRTVEEYRQARERGTNALRRVPAHDFAENLDAAVSLSKKRGFELVLVTCPYCPHRNPPFVTCQLPVYNRETISLAERTQTKLVDLETIFRTRGNRDFLPDGAHPDPRGHRLIAEQLGAAITSLPSFQAKRQ